MHKRLATLTDEELRGTGRGVVHPSVNRNFREGPPRPTVFTDDKKSFSLC